MTNQDLLTVVREYDSPIYVYDASKMEAQYKRLSSAFSKVKKVKINYAVKALSNISVLKLLHSFGAGMDTVSIQEVKLALDAGVPAEKIIYTPNGVSLEEIEKAAQLGVQINIDNRLLDKYLFFLFCQFYLPIIPGTMVYPYVSYFLF